MERLHVLNASRFLKVLLLLFVGAYGICVGAGTTIPGKGPHRFAHHAQGSSGSPSPEQALSKETGDLVLATSAGALASLLVAIAAVLMPKVQLSMTESARNSEAEAARSVDRKQLLHYINYFGEQLLHIEQASGETSASAHDALRLAMPAVLSLLRSLPDRLQDAGTFAFIDAYRVASQADHDDQRVIEMMQSFNLRRREAQGHSSPQTSQIMSRIEEDEARFKLSRAQIEEMTRNNASLARSQLDELSHSIGGQGVTTRSDVLFANPQDTMTDRFR